MDCAEGSKIIAHVRTEMGFTQQQMADALGVHQTTIMRWERGDQPVREVFVRAALALHKQLSEREEVA